MAFRRNMLNKLKPRSLPLAINICLLIALFAFTFLYSLFVDSITGRVFHILSGITAVPAIIPLISFVAEIDGNRIPPKRKSASTDVQQRVDKLCQLMCIKKKPTVKLVDGYIGAATQHSSLFLGKPLLDNLDDASINAVLAHELAHTKKRHGCMRIRKMIVPFLLLAADGLYFFTVRSISQSLNAFVFCVWAFLMVIIFARVVAWPQEYEADAVGAEYVTRDTMSAALLKFAELKHTNIEQDFYLHPSISRRIANLNMK